MEKTLAEYFKALHRTKLYQPEAHRDRFSSFWSERRCRGWLFAVGNYTAGPSETKEKTRPCPNRLHGHFGVMASSSAMLLMCCTVGNSSVDTCKLFLHEVFLVTESRVTFSES